MRSFTGIAKVTGVALSLAGVFAIAFYVGPSFRPFNHHHAFGTSSSDTTAVKMTEAVWIKGTFMAVLAVVAWSVWIVLQVSNISPATAYLYYMLSFCYV